MGPACCLKSLDAEGEAHRFSTGEIVAGRGIDVVVDPVPAGISLLDIPNRFGSVSRVHARLRCEGGDFWIENVGKHGTFVNGTRLAEKRRLAAGDRIQFGPDGPEYQFTPVAASAPAAGGAAEAVCPRCRAVLAPGEEARHACRRKTFTQRAGQMASYAVESMARGELHRRFLGVYAALGVALLVAGIGAVGLVEYVLYRMESREDRLQKALLKARESVYLVILRPPKGDPVGEGTAWAVGKGLLATNSHVAEVFKKLKPGVEMIVRSTTRPPQDLRVYDVTLHPGYGEWQRAVEARPPGDAGEPPGIHQLPGACDVALLKVREADRLAAPLPLATDPTLRSLKAGDEIGLVGFPMENVVGGGANVAQPEPTTQMGHVTAITDYFLKAGTTGHEHLVQHNLPVTGGASGSPILNAAGEVVAVLYAGNIVVVKMYGPEGSSIQRTPAAIGINYGQRADLVRELVDGRAEREQAARTKQWEQALKDFPCLWDLRAAQEEDQVRREIGGWAKAGGFAKVAILDEVKGSADTEVPGSDQFYGSSALRIPQAGKYLVLLIAQKHEMGLFLHAGADKVVAAQPAATWISTLPIEVPGPIDLDAWGVAIQKGSPYRRLLVQAQPAAGASPKDPPPGAGATRDKPAAGDRPANLELALRRRLLDWVRSIGMPRWVEVERGTGQIDQLDSKDNTWFTNVSLDIPGPGSYLVVTLSEGGDISLSLATIKDNQLDRVLGKEGPAPVCAVPVKADRPTKLGTQVVSGAKGMSYTRILFKAVREGGGAPGTGEPK